MIEHLWAPWRKSYIRPKKKKSGPCLFCRLIAQKTDRKNFILLRTFHSYAVLNLYPYNNGHTLILPKRHVDNISLLSDTEKLDLLDLVEKVRAAMVPTMTPHGFNIGINLGRVAGAGIPHHLHVHLVPRWSGDANFMPIIGKTKVISESLRSVYRSLAPLLKKTASQKRSIRG